MVGRKRKLKKKKHEKQTRPRKSWFIEGPWKQAWLRMFAYSSLLIPARRAGTRRISGLRGAQGLGNSWRSAPLRSAAAKDAVAIARCCKVFWGLRCGDELLLGTSERQTSSEHDGCPSFAAEESREFMHALAQLSSQLAGGSSAATRRKRREREEAEQGAGREKENLSTALLGFLTEWQK